jgi:hypothetical protein
MKRPLVLLSIAPFFLTLSLLLFLYKFKAQVSEAWFFGFIAALLLSWLLLWLSSKEIGSSLEVKGKQLDAEKITLENSLHAKERELKEQEIKYHGILNKLQSEQEGAFSQLELYKSLIAHHNLEMTQQRKENELFIDDLLAKERAIAALELKSRPVEIASPPSAEDKQISDLYKQLLIQFKEKTQLLHQARKELFCTENELLGLKMEIEEERMKEPEDQKRLMKMCSRLTMLEQNGKEEIDRLEELISHLFIPK